MTSASLICSLTHWLAAPSWEKNAFHIATAPLLILDLQMPLWQETLFSSQFTAPHMRKEVKPVWCWVPTTKGCGIRFELPEHQSPELQITRFSEPAAPLGVPAPVRAPPAPEKTLDSCRAQHPDPRRTSARVHPYLTSPALLGRAVRFREHSRAQTRALGGIKTSRHRSCYNKP